MSAKTKILSVDDNPQNRRIIELALREHFDVVSSDGNDPFVELVELEQPKIILLDIMLHEKSGFDLCKALRNSDQSAEIIVIFISALTSIEDKLTAYASGGDDYVCKPVDVVELSEKLKGIEKRIKEKEGLAEQCKQAYKTVFTLKEQASELGQLIGFLNESLTISTTDQLFQKISDFFASIGINFSLEFRLKNISYQYPTDIISTLETEILELGRNAKRIVSFGDNLLINSQWCSILVKHLPQDNEDFIGRARDNFAILLNIIDSRLMLINSENKRANERELALESLKNSVASHFTEIKQDILDQDAALLALLSDLAINMDQKTLSMGLTEEQEIDLIGLFEEVKEQFTDITGTAITIDNKLRDINNLLAVIH